MPHITIKRPEGSAYSFPATDGAQSSKAIYHGPLTHVGEIRHGIQAQYILSDNHKFSLRTPHKDHNYLQFAKAKNLNPGNDNDQTSPGLNKRHQLKNEKLARKGQEAFINHVINYVKNAARHGKHEVTMDIAETLDSFRQYRQQGSFDPHEHTRNLAMWLQSMMRGGQSNAHTVVSKAIITGLRAAGYKDAKIEIKYKKQIIKTQSQHQASINSNIFNKSSRLKTQLVSIPYNAIVVSTQCAKTPHLDNLNPKTQAVIRNKIPSWIGSIFN